MPRVYGNSPGNARSRLKSRLAMSAGVASGLTSIPLTVVKSFFHARFADAARHLPSSRFTCASVSSENSESCCGSRPGVGISATVLWRSRSLPLMGVLQQIRCICATDAPLPLTPLRGPSPRVSGAALFAPRHEDQSGSERHEREQPIDPEKRANDRDQHARTSRASHGRQCLTAPRTHLVHGQDKQRVVCEYDRKSPEGRAFDFESRALEK